MSYPCTKCGCCCKQMDKVVEGLITLNAEFGTYFKFPYKYDTSGRCEKLTADNRCSVYENRPTVCRIDRMIAILELDPVRTYRKTIKACNKLMEEQGVPVSFRIS
jgi:hypothetical protein